MKTLAELKRRIKVGTRLLCVQNSYIPKYNGEERTVVKTQTNAFVWSTASTSKGWTRWPKASGITFVDADTFRLSLELAAPHFVELRILS